MALSLCAGVRCWLEKEEEGKKRCVHNVVLSYPPQYYLITILA